MTTQEPSYKAREGLHVLHVPVNQTQANAEGLLLFKLFVLSFTTLVCEKGLASGRGVRGEPEGGGGETRGCPPTSSPRTHHFKLTQDTTPSTVCLAPNSCFRDLKYHRKSVSIATATRQWLHIR